MEFFIWSSLNIIKDICIKKEVSLKRTACLKIKAIGIS